MTTIPPVFGADQLAKIVRDTLPPAGDKSLVVVGTVDREGVQTVADFASHNGAWHLQAAYRHKWSGDNEVAARVIFEWPRDER